jgi:hypothetical protein
MPKYFFIDTGLLVKSKWLQCVDHGLVWGKQWLCGNLPHSNPQLHLTTPTPPVKQTAQTPFLQSTSVSHDGHDYSYGMERDSALIRRTSLQRVYTASRPIHNCVFSTRLRHNRLCQCSPPGQPYSLFPTARHPELPQKKAVGPSAGLSANLLPGRNHREAVRKHARWLARCNEVSRQTALSRATTSPASPAQDNRPFLVTSP